MSDRVDLSGVILRWDFDGGQGLTVTAVRREVLEALGAKWACREKWDTENYPCPPGSTVHGCHWAVPAGGDDE